MQRVGIRILLTASMFCSSAFAQEFEAPPTSERAYIAKISKLYGTAEVDGDYRIVRVSLGGECTNEELKGLAALERLKSIHISCPKVDDQGLVHLQGLSKVQSISFMGCGTSNGGVAALRKELPTCSISAFSNRDGGNSADPGNPVVSGRAASTTVRSSSQGGTNRNLNPSNVDVISGNLSLSRTSKLLLDNSVQVELKLKPEQRSEILEASNNPALQAVIKLVDDKMQAVLTAKQRVRIKQLELQQLGVSALVRADIVERLEITDSQVAAIRKQNEDFVVTARKATQVAFLQRVEGETEDDFTKRMREKIAEFNRTREAGIMLVLTKQQRRAWKSLIGREGPSIGMVAP